MSDQMAAQEAWSRGSQGAQAAYARRRVTIDPITRLEGHGKIDIFLDDAGDVDRAYFQVPELRGFEKFAEGRPAEDMPQITSRICGVCPTAHHMAATKALDALYGVEPPPAAKKIRELVYSAFMAEDHALHLESPGGEQVGRPLKTEAGNLERCQRRYARDETQGLVRSSPGRLCAAPRDRRHDARERGGLQLSVDHAAPPGIAGLRET